MICFDLRNVDRHELLVGIRLFVKHGEDALNSSAGTVFELNLMATFFASFSVLIASLTKVTRRQHPELFSGHHKPIILDTFS